MGITIINDSATISTTEYSLPADTTTGVPTSQTDDCIFSAFIGFQNMVAGDQYEVKLYESDGTSQQLVGSWIFTGVQGKKFTLPSLILGVGWDLTVKRLVGSDRTISWSLRKVT